MLLESAYLFHLLTEVCLPPEGLVQAAGTAGAFRWAGYPQKPSPSHRRRGLPVHLHDYLQNKVGFLLNLFFKRRVFHWLLKKIKDPPTKAGRSPPSPHALSEDTSSVSATRRPHERVMDSQSFRTPHCTLCIRLAWVPFCEVLWCR